MGYENKHIKILTPKEGYNLIFKEYKQYHDHLTSFDKGFFLSLLPRNKEDINIIDLGAGDGRIYKILKNKNYMFKSFVACDIAERLLQLHPGKFSNSFSELFPGIQKTICDLEKNLPRKDQTFDIAFSFFVLEHITNIENLFFEVERILKPGGQRIIGHFLQRREFVWKKNASAFKIKLHHYRIQDIEKIAQKNLFKINKYPIYEKGNLLGYLLLCEKI